MLQAQGVNIPRDLTGDEKRQLQDDVENMKVAQLKEICRSLSLTVSGRKSELQDKIMRKISDNYGYTAENYTLKLILMFNTIKWAASDRVDLPEPGDVLQDLVRGTRMIRSDDLAIVDVKGPTVLRATTNSMANVSFVQQPRHAAYVQPTPQPQRKQSQSRPLAETVIYFKQSPFYKLTRLLMKPMCIEASTKNRRHDRIDFSLSDEDFEGIKSGRYRVFWYSGRIVPNENIRDNADVEYPDHFSIYINGVDATPTIGSLKNRPADLTAGLRPGKNCVNLSFGPFHHSASVRGYMFYLNKVEAIKVDAIVQTIVERPHISKLADLQILKGDEDEDDDLIIEGAEVVTLKCPITMARMKIPGKSVKCKHLACFDLPAFLQLQSQAPMWKCIVCNDPIKFDDLAVDEFFKEITDETSGDVEYIELENNGNWKPKVEEGQPESEEEIEQAIVMDLNSPKNDRRPQPSQPSPLQRSSLPPPETIIILSDSDEEDEIVPIVPPRRNTNDVASRPEARFRESELHQRPPQVEQRQAPSQQQTRPLQQQSDPRLQHRQPSPGASPPHRAPPQAPQQEPQEASQHTSQQAHIPPPLSSSQQAQDQPRQPKQQKPQMMVHTPDFQSCVEHEMGTLAPHHPQNNRQKIDQHSQQTAHSSGHFHDLDQPVLHQKNQVTRMPLGRVPSVPPPPYKPRSQSSTSSTSTPPLAVATTAKETNPVSSSEPVSASARLQVSQSNAIDNQSRNSPPDIFELSNMLFNNGEGFDERTDADDMPLNSWLSTVTEKELERVPVESERQTLSTAYVDEEDVIVPARTSNRVAVSDTERPPYSATPVDDDDVVVPPRHANRVVESDTDSSNETGVIVPEPATRKSSSPITTFLRTVGLSESPEPRSPSSPRESDFAPLATGATSPPLPPPPLPQVVQNGPGSPESVTTAPSSPSEFFTPPRMPEWISKENEAKRRTSSEEEEHSDKRRHVDSGSLNRPANADSPPLPPPPPQKPIIVVKPTVVHGEPNGTPQAEPVVQRHQQMPVLHHFKQKQANPRDPRLSANLRDPKLKAMVRAVNNKTTAPPALLFKPTASRPAPVEASKAPHSPVAATATVIPVAPAKPAASKIPVAPVAPVTPSASLSPVKPVTPVRAVSDGGNSKENGESEAAKARNPWVEAFPSFMSKDGFASLFVKDFNKTAAKETSKNASIANNANNANNTKEPANDNPSGSNSRKPSISFEIPSWSSQTILRVDHNDDADAQR